MDTSARYTLNETYAFSFGVRNLGDERPPFVIGGTDAAGGGYDFFLGRCSFARIQASFQGRALLREPSPRPRRVFPDRGFLRLAWTGASSFTNAQRERMIDARSTRARHGLHATGEGA